MNIVEEARKPSKREQKVAMESYNALSSVISQIRSEQAQIEIAETFEKITVPVTALKFLGDILKAMSQGKSISIVPMASEISTQAAAEFLNCSRPYLVKLLEEGKIPFTKVGKHRRIKFEDVINFRAAQKEQQKRLLTEMMNADEETGLYDL